MGMKVRYCSPTGSKRYPKRCVLMDKDTGLQYIGFERDSEGKNRFNDWYDKIQKPKDSCCVRTLFEHAVESESTDILNQRKKVSCDLTGIPNNLLDVMNSFQNVKNYFESLPVEVKKDFGNNPYEFVKRSGKFSDSYMVNEKLKQEKIKQMNEEFQKKKSGVEEGGEE